MRLYLAIINFSMVVIIVILNTTYYFKSNRIRTLDLELYKYSSELNVYTANLYSVGTVSGSSNTSQTERLTYPPACELPNHTNAAIAALKAEENLSFPLTTELRQIQIYCQNSNNNFNSDLDTAISAAINEQKNALDYIHKLGKQHQKSRSDIWQINTILLLLILLLTCFFFASFVRSRNITNKELLKQIAKNQREHSRSQNIMLSMMEDTREQTRKALSLASQNQQLALIVQQSQNATLLLQQNGSILQANKAAMALFHLPSDVADNDFSIKILPHSISEFAVDGLNSMSETSPPKKSILSISDPASASQEIVLNCNLYPLPTPDTELLEFALTAMDVTYIHQAQDNLRRIIEQAPNALIMIDADGLIVMENSAACKLFGYTKGELTGEKVEKLVPPNARLSHPQLRFNFLTHPQIRTMGNGRDLTAIKKNGEEFNVEIGLNPLSTRDGMFVIASVVDLTDRIKQQQQLELVNNELQQRNFEMEQFIYTVSHDLKAPLVTIAGFADRLHGALMPVMSEKQAHQANRIRANIFQMERLLNDLVTLSRVIKLEASKTYVDTEAVLEDVLLSLENDIETSEAKINIEKPLAKVYANDRFLAQSLQNLISNAIKYRDSERPLSININTRETADTTIIYVEDNGIGIEQKYHDKIFKIFERLNVGEGTGIGLAIVRTVMEKHNGKIDLISTPGIGSTFILHFPHQNQG